MTKIDRYNNATQDLDTLGIIQWAKKEFGDGLYALSSFGTDSAVMFQVMKNAGVKIPIVTIDTGFWFDETFRFKKIMAKEYNLNIYTCRPSKDTLDYVKKEKLWETYPELYHEIVKLEPLREFIKSQEVKALLSGIRGGQTETRAKKHTVHKGSGGEVRIHPLLDWSQEDIDSFISEYKLPRHPLFYEGYASVGDWTTTRKGATRDESRGMMSEKMECGLHIDEHGRLVPLKSLRKL
jgi:phosphoadenosine phosphosulfate reductase